MTPLCLNARFLTRPGTGVDRAALELTRALLDQGLTDLRALMPDRPLGPAHAIPPALSQRIAAIPAPGPGALWEQSVLPALARGQPLLNLCNSSPLLHANQAVMLHDAQVWDVPQAYPRAFRLWYRALLPRIGHRARRVFAPSVFARSRLEARGVIPRDVALILPNAACHMHRLRPDPGALARCGLGEKGYHLAVGSGHAHKNLARLARAAAARRDRDPPLVIAGGPAPPGTRALGRVTDRELAALYRGALSLALPSLTEGFGLPALEAMTLGTPVLAARAGALPEICRDAALLLDPGDTPAWTRALDRLQSDPVLAQELSQRGRARAAAFTWARSAARLAEALEALQPRGAKPAGGAWWRRSALP